MKKTTNNEIKIRIHKSLEEMIEDYRHSGGGDRAMRSAEKDYILDELCKELRKGNISGKEFDEMRKSLDKADLNEAEVFYTGGGVWLSAKYVTPNLYQVVSTEDIDCLTLYDDYEEDDCFACQNMMWSTAVEELSPKANETWRELVKALADTLKTNDPYLYEEIFEGREVI